MLEMLKQHVKDVSFALEEKILQDLRLGFGHEGLQYLVKVPAQDGLQGFLVEEL